MLQTKLQTKITTNKKWQPAENKAYSLLLVILRGI